MPKRSFTDEQVIEICVSFANGEKNKSELAEEYNVSAASIIDILVFSTYTNVTSQLPDLVKMAISDRMNNKGNILKD
ncbi:hypothetical protein, partial [Mesobacillus boroniphilus]|uniref:hypothetical protein n=1 Tax=Mesobacillus boroniphilus TaxID=308892 RepID=UPI0004CE0C45